jgi:rubrerythrin
MTSCSHKKLALLPEQKNRLRCRHCHLTIKADDIGDSYCPECFEIKGKKQYDFEELKEEKTGTTIYRCEGCGITVECE